MRLIDADALIKTLETQDYSNAPNTLEKWTPQDLTNAEIFDINNAPTVDMDAITESHERIGYDRGFSDGYAQATSEVKHGHWVEVQRIHEKDHTAICECSLCGDTVWVYDGQRAWNYCPNCGAQMEAEDGLEGE